MTKPLIDLIAAARPNFMKVAPLYHALNAADWCRVRLVHTGQHYDPNMSQAFFDDLGLPDPDCHLGVGSGSHAEQTAGVMVAYENVCRQAPPDWIVVVGDVNSTMACAIVGAKLHIRVAHLEAGLRSRDRSMPEEINRLVTDAIADLLWTPSPDADENLRAEGVPQEKIEMIGNIMIDSFEMRREQIAADDTRATLGLASGEYGVVTMHRPANVDEPDKLRAIVSGLCTVAERLQLLFAVHPRTRKQLKLFDLERTLAGSAGVRLIEPVGYVQFMNLVTGAALVITDSGGIQEETTYLGIPCLTVRDNTERPITVIEGTNRLIGPHQIAAAAADALAASGSGRHRPHFWDGRTAERAAASLELRLAR